MSITVEKLSLLDALAPLRQKLDSEAVQQGRGFAEKLDKALGSGESVAPGTNDKARELAESLTLQMLHSSLTLAGDSPSDSVDPSGVTPFSSANALLQAYRTNLPSGGEQALPTPVTAPSQLQEFVDDVPGVIPKVAPKVQTPTSAADTAWLDPIILKASRKYGVDVGLIKAVIKAESNFNPQAVSHAGARGLMQLMPATARSLGVTDSFDAEQNVMGGTRFLKDMLKRYGGNVDSALAAYNWGPGNVDKRPDHLPRETREYLVRVKQLYASYNV
ncbi:MAG: lytic transglycosylase domain-containing protein [Geobacteraceae bacterium]|nr:lytic transglycosylase domain-containing protein [Geobacteraceae bacterium]NTW79627.1 lytic transglycosylase domain-containing protein [Geobacteraceae bacterium]